MTKRLAVVFCLAAAAAALHAGRLLSKDTIATITLIDGRRVDVRRAGEKKWAPAEEEMELAVGDRIRTGEASKAECQLEDNSILRVNEMTVITLKRPKEKSTRLEMDAGQVWMRLKELGKNSAFEVKTPQMVLGVKGTAFWVNACEGEDCGVAVEEGEVEVRRGEQRVRLQKLMETRLREGKLAEGAKFDPEKKKRWEKFTEKIVKERFDKLNSSIASYRDEAKDIAQKGSALIKDMAGLARGVSESAQGLSTLSKKAKRVSMRKEAVRQQLQRLGSVRMQGVKNRRLKTLRGTVAGLISDCEEIEAAVDRTKEKMNGYSEEAAALGPRFKALQEQGAELKKERGRFNSTIKKFQRERSFDPQWPKLKGVYDRISAHERKLVEHADAVDEALSGRAVETGKKAKDLKEKMDQIRQGVEERRDETAASLRDLRKTKKELEAMLDRINAALNG